MKKALLCLCCILPLYGCVPAAVLVGATAGGALIYSKRSFKTMHTDQHAANVAQYAVNHDPAIKNHAQIAITVFDNIGLMVGQASSAEARQRAYEIMSQVKGVRRIYNAVTIAAPISNFRRTKDAYITSKIRTEFLTASDLKSNDIKVVTEDSVVYLLGEVSRHQADLATQTTRKISGVSKVVKVFQYT
jgi:osmotically-inducible protein OsmY